jgi:hypothetical protein
MMAVGDVLAIGAVVASGGMLIAELRAARASLRGQGERLGKLSEKIWFREGYDAGRRDAAAERVRRAE